MYKLEQIRLKTFHWGTSSNLPLDFTSLYSHDEITECPNAVLVGLNYDYIDVVNVNGVSRDLAVLENISFLTIS